MPYFSKDGFSSLPEWQPISGTPNFDSAPPKENSRFELVLMLGIGGNLFDGKRPTPDISHYNLSINN